MCEWGPYSPAYQQVRPLPLLHFAAPNAAQFSALDCHQTVSLSVHMFNHHAARTGPPPCVCMVTGCFFQALKIAIISFHFDLIQSSAPRFLEVPEGHPHTVLTYRTWPQFHEGSAYEKKHDTMFTHICFNFNGTGINFLHTATVFYRRERG